MRISTLLAAAAVTAIAGAALAQPPAGGGGGGRGGFPGAQLTPEQLETAFKAGDANKDGKLDKAELPAALTARQAAQTAAMAAAAQAAGVEIPAGRGGGAAQPMTPEQVDAQFMRIDANMDGSISLDEFKAAPAGRGGGRGGPGGPGGGGRGGPPAG